MNATAANSYQVNLLGRMRIKKNGVAIAKYRTAKVQALLLYLLAENGSMHERHRLCDLLWPGLPEKSARSNLRTTVYFARQLLPGLLASQETRLGIAQGVTLHSDLDTFDALVKRFKGHQHVSAETCLPCKNALLQAAAMITGQFAEGFHLDDSNQFADWLLVKREAITRSYLSVLDTLIGCLLTLDMAATALDFAQKRLDLDLHSEAGYRQLMLVYQILKNRSAVMRVYQRCEQMMGQQWGISPSAETRTLLQETKLEQIAPTVVISTIGRAKFVAGPPIKDPQQFFGRKSELKRIKHWLDHRPMNHIAIVGKRRSGKTSLLHHMQHKLPHLRWAWVDFQDPRMQQLSTLLKHFGDTLGIATSGTLDDFMDKMLTRAVRQPTVILMDELGAGLAAPDLTQSFWWMLRALANSAESGMLSFCIAARTAPILLAEEQQKTSPFFNIFSTLSLGAFAPDEANQLMDSGGAGFTKQDRQWIRNQSERWPFLMQILCEERQYALEQDDEHPWQEAGLGRIEPYRYLLTRS